MIALNCDMGESFGAWTMGADEALMPFIDWSNIACGFHAGSPTIMAQTIALAKQANVHVGAHPAYPDLAGFGRRSLGLAATEVEHLVRYQVGAMQALCAAAGVKLHHVKPHGALYNDMQTDVTLLRAVCKAVAASGARLVTLAGTLEKNQQIQAIAAEYDVSVAFEADADRRYQADGQLRPRRYDDAVVHDIELIVQQALAFARGEALTAVTGESLLIVADTLCVHGDNPAAVAAVKAIRQALNNQS